MRIVSLLPSTTEILFGLGAGEDVVGVTFECDTPTEARSRTIVSSTTMPEGLSPRQIDDFVATAMAEGEDLYRLDADALRSLDADLVVTQDLCAVCAVDVATVDDALGHLGCSGEVLTVDPHTLEEVLQSILVIGGATGRQDRAESTVAELRARLSTVEEAVRGRPRPRVLLLEWTDPPFAPGHWIPEMVTRAGGLPVVGRAGERSYRMSDAELRDCDPDLVVCAPCGFSLDQAAELGREALGSLPRVPVWAVDANASFARPGPRVVDGIETLARIFHPEIELGPAGASLRLR